MAAIGHDERKLDELKHIPDAPLFKPNEQECPSPPHTYACIALGGH